MGQLLDITVRTQIITMKTSTVFAVALVCMSCLTVSQAFFFGNDGLMSMMFMMNMLGAGGPGGGGGSPMMGGINPMMFQFSGSDNMKRLGTTMMLSNMMKPPGGPPGAP